MLIKLCMGIWKERGLSGLVIRQLTILFDKGFIQYTSVCQIHKNYYYYLNLFIIQKVQQQ